ncbi:MAG: malate dehydrogenase [Anaerohalosphaeraceae bacterium]
MSRQKITVVGAGNVGAATAHIAAQRNLGDVVVVDIVKGLAEGKALDMAEMSGVYPFSGLVSGTTDWAATANSDVVIITSGVPRKPGMSRDDLLAINAKIVKSVTEQVAKYSPNSYIIVVCNPLDVMLDVAGMVSRFPKNRVMGMAGVLDSARFVYFVAQELNVSVGDVTGVLMGGHGDDMVPLPRYTSVAGIPLPELMDASVIQRLVDRARNGGIEIVNLLGYSAYYAPAAGAVRMTEAILQDKKSVLSCCAWCDAQYHVGGAYVGVPVILGKDGVEKVIELKLTAEEQQMLDASVGRVKALVAKVHEMI